MRRGNDEISLRPLEYTSLFVFLGIFRPDRTPRSGRSASLGPGPLCRRQAATVDAAPRLECNWHFVVMHNRSRKTVFCSRTILTGARGYASHCRMHVTLCLRHFHFPHFPRWFFSSATRSILTDYNYFPLLLFRSKRYEADNRHTLGFCRCTTLQLPFRFR